MLGRARGGSVFAVASDSQVQDSIAGFGGDPDRVTIMGESAGSGSITHHLAMPRSGWNQTKPNVRAPLHRAQIRILTANAVATEEFRHPKPPLTSLRKPGVTNARYHVLLMQP
jgi:acetyl esterase/lipase